jgi:hypothetical protein
LLAIVNIACNNGFKSAILGSASILLAIVNSEQDARTPLL